MVCRLCHGSGNFFIHQMLTEEQAAKKGLTKRGPLHWVTCPWCLGAGTLNVSGPGTIQMRMKIGKDTAKKNRLLDEEDKRQQKLWRDSMNPNFKGKKK